VCLSRGLQGAAAAQYHTRNYVLLVDGSEENLHLSEENTVFAWAEFGSRGAIARSRLT
jgi:hypothetical protein